MACDFYNVVLMAHAIVYIRSLSMYMNLSYMCVRHVCTKTSYIMLIFMLGILYDCSCLNIL